MLARARYLTNMTRLTLAHNKLTGKWAYFPISSLSNLTELRLTGNMLREPPTGVARFVCELRGAHARMGAGATGRRGLTLTAARTRWQTSDVEILRLAPSFIRGQPRQRMSHCCGRDIGRTRGRIILFLNFPARDVTKHMQHLRVYSIIAKVRPQRERTAQA